MVKYLCKKNTTYWYRRKIKGYPEILLSLKTKNYSLALVRHSYITLQINQLIYQGAFETMTKTEIEEAINSYKRYMLENTYCKFREMRDREHTINIEGKTYGGHTEQALRHVNDRYQEIFEANDYERVKAEVQKILRRSNLITDYMKLSSDDEKTMFNWELFKAEFEILRNAYYEQEGMFPPLHNVQTIETVKPSPPIQSSTLLVPEKNILISELVNKYIKAQRGEINWSDKNLRDIRYVFKHLISYFGDINAEILTHDDFLTFRDEVVEFLPVSTKFKEFQDKTTKEIVEIVQKNKWPTLGLVTKNKHLRRLHQVFNWGAECGYISKNWTKNLKIALKKGAIDTRKNRTPYDEQDLKNLFESSPFFTDELLIALKHKPSMIFIPLLSLYTGAKPTELALLRPEDIKTMYDIKGIDFGYLKTEYSIRFTPLADALIDLGFLDFVKYQKKQKHKQLFPEIKEYKSGGTDFTNKINIYCEKYVSQHPKKSFYSIRHFVLDVFKHNDIKVYIMNDIVGHSSTGNSNKDVSVYGGARMKPAKLQEVINKCLVYDFIDFSKIKEGIAKVYK